MSTGAGSRRGAQPPRNRVPHVAAFGGMALIGLGLLGAYGAAALAQTPPAPLSINFGYAPSAPLPVYYVGMAINAFEEQGVRLKVENMADAPFLLDMLQAKKLDMSGGATAAVIQRRALGSPLKIVCSFGYSFTEKSGRSWEGVSLIAPKSRNIEKVADLKGKKVAVVAFSSTWDIVLRERLKDAGVSPRDVTILAMPFTQMASALASGEVDAAAITATEYVRVSRTTPVNVLMTASQLTGVKLDVTQFVVGREDWLAQNEEATVRFIKALLKAHIYMVKDIKTNGGAEIKRIIKQQLKYDDFLTEATYDYRVGGEAALDEVINPLDVPRSIVAAYGNILTAGGLLRGKPPTTFDEVVDLKYLKRAVREVGLTWDESKVEK